MKWSVRILLVVAVAVVVLGFVLPWAMSTEALRGRIERVASASLDRDVSVEDIAVAPFFTSVRLHDLTIENPPGYPESPMLQAPHVRLDVAIPRLLEGRLEGAVRADDLVLDVVRRGEASNLDGLGGTGEPARRPALDLRVDLENAQVTLRDLETEQTTDLDGVGLEMRITDASRVPPDVRLSVDSLRQGALRLEDIEVDAQRRAEILTAERVRATFEGGGRLEGTGSISTAENGPWRLSLEATDVSLDDPILPLAGALFPLLAGAGEGLDGRLDGTVQLEGRGLTWAEVRRSLDGRGEIEVADVELPNASLLEKIPGLELSKDPIDDGSSSFVIEEGWVRFDRIAGGPDELALAGRVSLGGELDLDATVEDVPFRIAGTVTRPVPRPPSAEKAARKAAKELLERWNPMESP